MGKIISLTGCKGGCRASTLTAALGHELSAAGKSVCLLDGSIGMRALDIILRVQDKVVFDLYDLCEDICSMEQALVQVNQNLYMIAAPQLDVTAQLNEKKLQHLLKRLEKRFDCVLIDVSYVFSPVSAAFYRNSNESVLIATSGDIAGRNLERICAFIREEIGIPVSCIANFTESNSKQAGQIQNLISYLDIPLTGAVPFYEAVFLEALDQREYDAYPGKIKAAVRNAAKKLDGNDISLNLYKTRRLPWHS